MCTLIISHTRSTTMGSPIFVLFHMKYLFSDCSQIAFWRYHKMPTTNSILLHSLAHFQWKRGMERERKERTEDERSKCSSLWSFQVNSSQTPSLYLGKTSHPLWLELDFLAIHSNNSGIVIIAFEANSTNCLSPKGQRQLSIFEIPTFQIVRQIFCQHLQSCSFVHKT